LWKCAWLVFGNVAKGCAAVPIGMFRGLQMQRGRHADDEWLEDWRVHARLESGRVGGAVGRATLAVEAMLREVVLLGRGSGPGRSKRVLLTI